MCTCIEISCLYYMHNYIFKDTIKIFKRIIQNEEIINKDRPGEV